MMDNDYSESQTQSQRESLNTEEPEAKRSPDHALLIEAVQGFVYLYDLSHKLYKDAKKKHQAWEQIGEILNCSVDDCMKAWKNLRDRFLKEKRIQAGSSGAEAIYSNWPYYDAMLFYNKYTKPRNTYTATQKKKLSTSTIPSRPSSGTSVWSSVSLESLTSPENIASHGSEASSDEEIDGSIRRPKRANLELPSGSQQPISQAPGGTPTSTASRKINLQRDPGMERLMEIANSLANRLEKPPIPKNANSTFVDYLYQELEKMSEEEAKKKRKEILLMFFNENTS